MNLHKCEHNRILRVSEGGGYQVTDSSWNGMPLSCIGAVTWNRSYPL